MRNELSRLVLCGLLAVLPACETAWLQHELRLCGAVPPDYRPWARLRRASLDLAPLRALADRDSAHYPKEAWFALPTGEVMLCRSDGRRGCAGSEAWWQFRPDGATWVVTRHEEIVTTSCDYFGR